MRVVAGIGIALRAVAVVGSVLLGLCTARAASAASPTGAGCYPIDLTWICISGSSSAGSPGSGASHTYTCTFAKASRAVLEQTDIGPPLPGYQWDIMTCPGSTIGPLGGQLVQVNVKTGIPAIRPVDLLKIGTGQLSVPVLSPRTAPPLGKNSLVGLPEWFWVPRWQWRNVSITVVAGPVWAVAVASPTSMTYVPGGGLSALSCPGPGAEFRIGQPANSQHTNCSFTYDQPSAGLWGHAYQAALVVTWTISWIGSGGAGGTITTDYTTGSAFSVRVAQAEALVSTP
jgi:hypothetical protein